MSTEPENWQSLCEQVLREEDPKKLADLVARLSEALERNRIPRAPEDKEQH